ncbi:MAG: cadmium-translocating P-type ATPase [Desulfobacterales bacterium]|nr:cadmium-translocating P-type ATPase [Desulfobacterales bacterium]
MQTATMKRYQVRNLDCAACAAKLENNLKKMEGVDDAVIDFAGLTLHIQARDTARIQEMVRRIEPAVELIPITERAAPAPQATDRYRFRREIALLGVSLILFVVHMLFEERLHAAWFGWEYLLVLAAYLPAGWNVWAAAFRTVRRGDLFDENVLMTIATVGAMAIHALSEAVAVMLFYKVGELLQERAVARSRRSVGALLNARPQQATLQTLGGLQVVPPEQVAVGQTIVVKPGDKIPLDGTVLGGQSQVDASPLTGESRPQSVRPGESVLAGAINLHAALTVRVTRLFRDSSIVQILDLVQNAAARKARTEKLITTFARYYTPAVVLAAALIALVPPLSMGADFRTWIYRALVLLVISCPCALVVSVPLGYFGGIGRASRRGILVKGSNFLDALAHVKTVVFDKTGTLTQGVFEVEQVVTANGYSPEQVLAFAAAAEMHANHPIGASIVRAFIDSGGKLEADSVTDHAIMAGRGVRARWLGKEIVVGNDALLHQEDIAHEVCAVAGTVAHVTVDGHYAGHILIGDRLKPEAVQAIKDLRAQGVTRLVMLTGDNQCAAEQVAVSLGLDRFEAGLLPEDKVRHLERLMAEAHGGKVAYVGDGINDAPVLARADVGVAMGGLGSDAAIETADVVLMTDSPAKLGEAIAIARGTRRIVWQNIFLALGVKGIFVVLGALGVAGMWEAVFADMGTALLAVINATRSWSVAT